MADATTSDPLSTGVSKTPAEFLKVIPESKFELLIIQIRTFADLSSLITQAIKGKPVQVKLNSGVDYRGAVNTGMWKNST